MVIQTRRRPTMAMQRTVQTVTQIAFAIWPPARPAAIAGVRRHSNEPEHAGQSHTG